jgi:hypothetical protein
MEKIVHKLQQLYPSISFVKGDDASWSAEQQMVTYVDSTTGNAVWTTLHEVGHALLHHSSYESDMDLLNKEVEAWRQAKTLGQKFGIIIDSDHIQQCLDTYRDWLHKRSVCPHCGSNGLEHPKSLYYCLNCQNTWKVGNDRFCRPYRLKKAQVV